MTSTTSHHPHGIPLLPLRKIPLMLFCFAFSIRVAFILLQTYAHPFDMEFFAMDSFAYDALARSLISGEGYLIGGMPTARYLPGYPVFLAGVYLLFGSATLTVGLIQAALGALSTVTLYHIGKRLFHTHVGLLSALLFAIYPHGIFWTGYVLSETLYVLVLLLFLLSLVHYAHHPSRARVVCSAALFSVALYIRPVLFAFPLFLMFWFCALHRRKILPVLTHAAVFALVCLLLFAPWIIRNALIFHAFVPLSTNTGYNLYTLSGPGTTGGRDGYITDAVDIPPLNFSSYGHSLSEKERSDIYLQVTLDHITAHPELLPTLTYRKFWNTWRPNYANASLRNMFVMVPPYLAVVLFASIGIWYAYASRPRYDLLLLFLLYHLLFHSFITGMIRYRLPVEPVLMLFAVYGAMQLYRRMEHFRTRPVPLS